jgi:hypothetical protein
MLPCLPVWMKSVCSELLVLVGILEFVAILSELEGNRDIEKSTEGPAIDKPDEKPPEE